MLETWFLVFSEIARERLLLPLPLASGGVGFRSLGEWGLVAFEFSQQLSGRLKPRS